MTKKIGLFPVALLFCIIACKKEQPSRQTVTDIPQKEAAAISPKSLNIVQQALARLLAGPVFGTDWSGTVQVVIVTNQATGKLPQVNVGVPSDYALVGGGAVISPTLTEPGALITASYPDSNLVVWHASSKSFVDTFTHTLTAYAIGLKLMGLTSQQLKSNMWLFTSSPSPSAPHPATSVSVSSNYALVGGGAKIDYGAGRGSYLVASRPSGSTWYVEGKDHGVSSPATITAYAIGLKTFISPFGTLEAGFDSTIVYASSGFGVAPVTTDSSWVVTCPGGLAQYAGPGRMLTALLPGINYAITISKDQQYLDGGNTLAYIAKIRRTF